MAKKMKKKPKWDNLKKKNTRGQIRAILLLVVLIAAWWLSLPRSSTIYFDGTADSAVFSTVLDSPAIYGIKKDAHYNGEIKFEAEKTETMYVVKASMPEDKILEIQENGFPDWESSDQVFPFNDGSATLFAISEDRPESRLLMKLRLEPPEDERLTYDIEITRVKEDGNAEINQIELKNFSGEPIVKLSCACNIGMGRTAKQIPKGLYRITGCRSIKFFAAPGGPEDSENGYNPQLNRSLERFQYLNTGEGRFEITYYAQMQPTNVGHIEVEGQVQKEQVRSGQCLDLKISDIGQYPIPVKVSGHVGELKMAGKTRYPNFRQLILDKSPDLLTLILGGIIGILISRAMGQRDS